MTFVAQHIRSARLHLQKNDDVMRRIIKRVGPCTIKKRKHHFQTLVWSIIGQQISAAAAKTVYERLLAAVDGDVIRPDNLKQFSVDDLRNLGITRPKAGYLLHLTDQVDTGNLQLGKLSRIPDQEVVTQLKQVKGIGIWTAQIFLIFSLARLDVFPQDDLALQSAIQKNYRLRMLPDAKKMKRLAKRWQPYSSIASWYLWRTVHLDREQ